MDRGVHAVGQGQHRLIQALVSDPSFSGGWERRTVTSVEADMALPRGHIAGNMIFLAHFECRGERAMDRLLKARP